MTKTPMPTARSSIGAASLNGIVYTVGGGVGFCTPVSTVEAYNPATDTWTTKAPLPTPRYSLAVVVVNQILYAIGGGQYCNDAGDQATVEAYNAATDTWVTKASMPIATRDLSATVINGIIYVVGGDNQSATYAYDPGTDTWTTRAAVTPQRHGGAAGAMNGIMYWTGGSDSAVDAYNPVADSWTRKPSSIPTPRYNPGVGVVTGRIYLVGGSGQATAVESYDPATDTWTTQTPMPTGRDASVAVVNGVLYALGGNKINFDKFATNEAFTPEPFSQAPTLTSSAFYGGAGDQRGTAIAVGGGALYISGNVQPESQSPSDTALVLKYALPSGPSPVWARSYGFGTDFFGITATNEGVYAAGQNYSLTTDGVGGKEDKSILAKFAPDGSDGPAPGGALWLGLPHFFPYTGVESFQAATTAVEGGSPFIYAVGGGQPCSYFAYVITKFDALGNLLAKATDPGQENAFNGCYFNGTTSVGMGVTALNGNVYAAGLRSVYGSGVSFPTIWKHAPDLSVVWTRQDTSLSGQFNAVTAFGNSLYGVGFAATPGVANSENYLIQKYDETGTLLWSQTSGGANTDVLTGVVGIGTRLFAVGYTQSSGAGGADSVVLEIDPATGATLSTTLFGGALDDKANGAATDGTDLYVVGESKSFASAEGNTVGQNDVMLLRYSFEPAPTPTPTPTATATATPTATATATPTVAPTPTPSPTPAATATATATPTATATATPTATATATATPTPTPTPTPGYSAQIQPPINADGTSAFNANRGVVPVKFTLTLNGTFTCALPPATIAVTRTAGGTVGGVNESVYSIAADNGSNFKIDGCQYVFNLSSSALGTGTYRVDVMINGQVVGSATFKLK